MFRLIGKKLVGIVLMGQGATKVAEWVVKHESQIRLAKMIKVINETSKGASQFQSQWVTAV